MYVLSTLLAIRSEGRWQNLLYRAVTRIEYSAIQNTLLDQSRHSTNATSLLLPSWQQVWPGKVLWPCILESLGWALGTSLSHPNLWCVHHHPQTPALGSWRDTSDLWSAPSSQPQLPSFSIFSSMSSQGALQSGLAELWQSVLQMTNIGPDTS